MTKWVCSVCGYVYEGENAPEVCPVCKAPADKFIKQGDEMTCRFVSFQIDVQGVFVLFAAKIQKQPGFTRLAESLENERFAAGAFFPLDQGIGTFSSHKNFPFKGL